MSITEPISGWEVNTSRCSIRFRDHWKSCSSKLMIDLRYDLDNNRCVLLEVTQSHYTTCTTRVRSTCRFDKRRVVWHSLQVQNGWRLLAGKVMGTIIDILLLIKEAHIYIYIYMHVCSHFLNPLTPLFKARFNLYLYTTARYFPSKWTMGSWHQSNIFRAPVSILMCILFSYLKSCTRPVKLSLQGLQENDLLEVDLLKKI